MPASIRPRRDTGKLQQAPNVPDLVPASVPYWSPPKGVNYLTRASRIQPNFMWDARNYVIVDGRIEPRAPINALGTTAGRPCEVGLFITKDGFIHIFRMTGGTALDPGTVQYWNGASWVTPTGAPVLTGNVDDHLSYTAWNNQMVWTNGRDGLYNWNWATSTVTLITANYIPEFVTTFMSRIFMGNVFESGNQLYERMRWSVKDNSLDYTGIGSGYEDFLSTPGGYVDKIQAIVPVNDVQALAIRENSTWLISETGNVDAPVRIGRQFAGLGTKSPRSFVSVVGGALGLFNDGIYVVSESSVKNIGQQIIRRIQESVIDYDQCVGTYDNNLKRYSLVLYDDDLQRSLVYQYSFNDESWMVMDYPIRINSMQYASSPLVGLTIDTSPGTFDAAVGTIDSEIGSAKTSQLFFGGSGASGQDFVYSEGTFDDATILTEESSVESYLITGLIQADSPLRHTTLLEVQIEYEASEITLNGLTLVDGTSALGLGTIEYSTDLGATWQAYSSQQILSTNGPKIMRFIKVITGHNIQLRFSTSLAHNKFKLLAFVPLVVRGGFVHP